MVESSKIIALAKKAFQTEGNAVLQLANRLDESFLEIVELIYQTKGRTLLTGVGKSAIIGQKITATLNSTGTPALFMHAADAIHGDLGMLQKEDVVICLSQSGNTPEIKVLLPLVQQRGNKIIAICGNTESELAKRANHLLNSSIDEEACPLNLAPTTSTAVQMALGDALAVCLLEYRGFTSEDFAAHHPGGSLGKKLYLRVSDLAAHNQKPEVSKSHKVQDVILSITSSRLGATVVLEDGNIIGIITDGDIRRMLESNSDWKSLSASEIMSANPKQIKASSLAVEALELMRNSKVGQLVVVENGKYSGMIHLHDLMREGIL